VELRAKEARILGDYTIIKQIGQGSLGTVYLAEHRFMKRQFVLKVFPEELATDRSFIQRFEEEVALLASLEHPHIVKIHNISFGQGQYFLVTDCIVDELGETTNLAQHMISRGKRLEEEELFQILHQIADALDYAHSKKVGGKVIAHRGIKLNNILVGQQKPAIDVYLSDFGLSRIVGTGAVLSRTYRVVAEALGAGAVVAKLDRYPVPPIENNKLIPLHASFLQNYAFLAPEQKRAADPARPIDGKVDSYAFGVLAFYLLMGEFPEGYFDLPSSRLPDFKFDWDLLVKQCLATDPEQRPELLLPLLVKIKQGIPKVSQQKSRSEETIDHLEMAVPSQRMEDIIAHGEALKTASDGMLRPIIHSAQLERPMPDLDPAAKLQIDPTVKHYCPERNESINIQPIQIEMKVIEGGVFYRGSNDGNRDEMPRHQVTLASFAIDVHPVTNEQFVRFLEAMGGEKDNNHQDIIRLRDSRIKRSGGRLSIESGYAKHPVVGVTWYGAVGYAKWVGKRLPTEAEWEIASRGTKENALYPTGDDIEKSQANFFSSDTTAVMSYAPNGCGLYDMAGNVYEWCYDWYGYNYYETSIQEPENPTGPLQGVYRVLRGGCWKSLKEDLRTSRRHRNNPGTVNGTYGFRCAADVG
jgi:formylglycine-generating enzyme required for sulfatase activity